MFWAIEETEASQWREENLTSTKLLAIFHASSQNQKEKDSPAKVVKGHSNEEDALRTTFMALAVVQKMCCLQESEELQFHLKLLTTFHQLLRINVNVFLELLKKFTVLSDGAIKLFLAPFRFGAKMLGFINTLIPDTDNDISKLLKKVPGISAFLESPNHLRIIVDLLVGVPQVILQRYIERFRAVVSSIYGQTAVDREEYLKQGQNMDIASGRLRLALFYYTSGDHQTALSYTYDVINDFQNHVIYVSQHPLEFIPQDGAVLKNGWFDIALDVSFNKSKHELKDPNGVNILVIIDSSSDVVDFPPMAFVYLLQFFCYYKLGNNECMESALSLLKTVHNDKYHTRSDPDIKNEIYKQTVESTVNVKTASDGAVATFPISCLI
ncbi:hypothetical protein ScPMuIL_000214 [Solemya velum]